MKIIALQKMNIDIKGEKIMLFKFKIEKPKDAETTFKKLKERIEIYNGELLGDVNSGVIKSDGVEGEYIFGKEFIEITIQKKPIYLGIPVPNSLVEKKIRSIFKKISM